MERTEPLKNALFIRISDQLKADLEELPGEKAKTIRGLLRGYVAYRKAGLLEVNLGERDRITKRAIEEEGLTASDLYSIMRFIEFLDRGE